VSVDRWRRDFGELFGVALLQLFKEARRDSVELPQPPLCAVLGSSLRLGLCRFAHFCLRESRMARNLHDIGEL